VVDETYLDGPPLCGLYGFFEADFGAPDSPKPYPRVTPSRVGGLLLPFRCPCCPATIDFSDPKNRADYCDPRPLRGNHYCPRCGARFLLNTDGQPLDGELATDGAAPSMVETVGFDDRGLIKLDRRTVRPGGSVEQYLLGCDLLGTG